MTQHNIAYGFLRSIALAAALIVTGSLAAHAELHLDITKGKIQRKNGSVVLMDTDGKTEKIRWNFTDGWVCKWEGPAFNATSNAVAVQTMEICHEGITQV